MRIDTIIFAIITFYILYRLWRILGMRVGIEYDVSMTSGEVVVLKEEENIEEDASQHYIETVQKYMPDFDAEHFIEAAEIMLSKIVEAFAEGNVNTLRKFICTPLCDAFEKSIEERMAAGKKREAEVISVKGRITSVEIEKTKSKKPICVRIFVQFESEQIIVTSEPDGSSYDNPSRIPTTLVDNWVFIKHLNADDPIWYVESTSRQKYGDK